MTMFKRTVRSGLFAAVAALGIAASQAPASAATFSIAFDAFFFGTDGTGTFDAPNTGGPISNFSAVFGSTTFNKVVLGGNLSSDLKSIDLQVETTNPVTAQVLVVFNLLGNNLFGDASCQVNKTLCIAKGTYTISQIPVPAALPLFAAGLAGVGYVSRRKRRA